MSLIICGGPQVIWPRGRVRVGGTYIVRLILYIRVLVGGSAMVAMRVAMVRVRVRVRVR